jgi:hypothetical protein
MINDLNSKKYLEETTGAISNLTKQIATPMNFYKSIANSISEIAKQQINLGISDIALTAFKESVSNLTEMSQSLAKIVAQQLKESTEWTHTFRQFRDEEKVALKETGWIMCPSVGGMFASNLRLAVVKYNKGDKGKALTNLMKDYYGVNNNWNRLEKTIHIWKTNKLFTKQRMKIIEDCFWAHSSEKYTLSIPSLLPIIEGVAGDYCKRKGLKIPESKSTKKAKETAKLLEKQGDNYESEILLSLIESQLYIDSSKLKKNRNKKYLNRHGILHGSYSGYADSTRSLKCFLVLDVLSSLKV